MLWSHLEIEPLVDASGRGWMNVDWLGVAQTRASGESPPVDLAIEAGPRDVDRYADIRGQDTRTGGSREGWGDQAAYQAAYQAGYHVGLHEFIADENTPDGPVGRMGPEPYSGVGRDPSLPH